MQQTADGGLIFVGSMRNLDSEGHMGAMLMKVGKKEETNGTLNTIIGGMNRTSISTSTGLTAVQSSTENIPAENAAGFETVLAIMILLTLYKKEKRRIK